MITGDQVNLKFGGDEKVRGDVVVWKCGHWIQMVHTEAQYYYVKLESSEGLRMRVRNHQ